MSYAHSHDAIVLKTYDTGEADRYCILFTRGAGRVAARASGARKIGSRLGGSLLPFSRIKVQLKESSAGFIIASAALQGEGRTYDIQSFAQASEGIELLLCLLQEDEPVEEIFDLTLQFLETCGQVSHLVLAYTFALLQSLGSLPGPDEMSSVVKLSTEEHNFIHAAVRGGFTTLPQIGSMRLLSSLADTLLRDLLPSAPRKAPGIAALLQKSEKNS